MIVSGWKKNRSYVAIVLAQVLFSSCSLLPKEKQEDLISAGISVNVVPWDNAKGALLSSFKLSETQALALALTPTVGASSRSRLDALRGGLSINLSPSDLIPTGQTTQTGSSITDIVRSGPPPTGDVARETTTTGTSSTALTEGPAPGPGSTETDLSDFTSLEPELLASALGDDPFRRFAAAAALRAQVKLLDARIRQASAQKDAQPYLLQLEITANPRRRDLPYDLHTTVSFELYETTDAIAGSIEVIPLFSNVDFERVNLTDLAESIREANLDVGATVGSFGGQLGAGAGAREQARFVARNLNALTSITRITDQEIEVRTGARWVGEDSYKLLAPSQNIIALLLVNKSEKQPDAAILKTIARQQLVDGEDGQELRIGKATDHLDRMGRIVDDFDLALHKKTTSDEYICRDGTPVKKTNTANEEERIEAFEGLKHHLGPNGAKNARVVMRKRLADAWLNGNDNALYDGIVCLSGDPDHFQDVRLAMAGSKRSTRYAIDKTQLPVRRTPELPAGDEFKEQLVYYSNSDKGVIAKVALNGPAYLDGLQASLVVRTSDNTSDKQCENMSANDNKCARLIAQKVSWDDTALNLTFPPIDDKQYEVVRLDLRTAEEPEAPTQLTRLYKVDDTVFAKPDRRIALSTGLTVIAADADGQASLLLSVTKGKDADDAANVLLTASGGQIKTVESGSVAGQAKGGAFKLDFDETYTLSLQNLIPGQTLVLETKALDATGKPLKALASSQRDAVHHSARKFVGGDYLSTRSHSLSHEYNEPPGEFDPVQDTDPSAHDDLHAIADVDLSKFQETH